MICLSKADEASFRHMAFNQSPRALDREHTTRQDMNGLANLREHVAADQDDGSGGGAFASGDPDKELHTFGLPVDPRLDRLRGARRWSKGPSSYPQATSGGEDQRRRPFPVLSSEAPSSLRNWVTWIASVILVSLILTSLSVASISRWGGRFIGPSYHDIHQSLSSGDAGPYASAIKSPKEPAPRPNRALPKRAACASGGVSPADYDLPLHVGALLIIWFVSTLGSSFALLAKKFPGLHIPPLFFFGVRHFGTGVLIATAFVHLLPTAFLSLGDPCLGDFWVNDYPAMPGAIALAAIFLVTIIEMVFHPSRRQPIECAPDNEQALCSEEARDTVPEQTPRSPALGPQAPAVREMAPPRSRSQSSRNALNRLPTTASLDGSERPPARSEKKIETDTDETPTATPTPSEPSDEQRCRRERLQVVLLELGILFHSIFIGMALSVSVGNNFIVLLVAIVFHQSFEGLALGSRIATVKWTGNKYQPWLMALAYGCTTPLGQAIGIATHTLYSPDSLVGLIVVGVMNAISAGLLTFASLVELLAEDFLSDDSWSYLRGRKRVVACLLVFFGAFGMSLVGAWA